MTPLAEINRRDLHRDFCEGTGAQSAWKQLLKGKDESALRHWLRHHADEGVDDPKEIDFRENVDDLLEFFGLLEIGLHIGYLDESTAPAYWPEVVDVLNRPSVKTYYEMHYPLELPKLLRKRLTHERRYRRVAAPPNLFIEFQTVINRLNRDPDLWRFLSFMDSFYFGDLAFDDVLEALEDPAVVAQYMLDRRPGPMGEALRGFDKMLAFIIAFDEITIRARNWATFESRLWHFSGYWFRQMRRNFGGDLRKSIKVIAAWQHESLTTEDRAIQASHVRTLQHAVRNVVYRAPSSLRI